MRKVLLKITAALFVALFLSCEDVFHNDALDYMWRLDSVEYSDSLDFYGRPCLEESKDGLWISFARDLVWLESSNSEFSAIGIFIDKGDYPVFGVRRQMGHLACPYQQQRVARLPVCRRR